MRQHARNAWPDRALFPVQRAGEMLAFRFPSACERSFMATLVIKNLPDALHARLKKQAQAHHRSLTKEAIVLLEQGLSAPRRAAPKLAPPLQLAGGYRPTIEDIEAAIAEGRD